MSLLTCCLGLPAAVNFAHVTNVCRHEGKLYCRCSCGPHAWQSKKNGYLSSCGRPSFLRSFSICARNKLVSVDVTAKAKHWGSGFRKILAASVGCKSTYFSPTFGICDHKGLAQPRRDLTASSLFTTTTFLHITAAPALHVIQLINYYDVIALKKKKRHWEKVKLESRHTSLHPKVQQQAVIFASVGRVYSRITQHTCNLLFPLPRLKTEL